MEHVDQVWINKFITHPAPEVITCRTAVGMAHVARPAGGKAAQSADEEDGDDDASSEGSRRGGLLGYLLGLLSRGSEEFVPWISCALPSRLAPPHDRWPTSRAHTRTRHLWHACTHANACAPRSCTSVACHLVVLCSCSTQRGSLATCDAASERSSWDVRLTAQTP